MEPIKCDWHIGNPLHFLWVKWKQCPSSGCGALLQSVINYIWKEIEFTQWRKRDISIQCLTFSPSRWKIKTISSGPALDDDHISLVSHPSINLSIPTHRATTQICLKEAKRTASSGKSEGILLRNSKRRGDFLSRCLLSISWKKFQQASGT